MKYFSLPADFKRETIDQYARLNDCYPEAKIVETYGNITLGSVIESGRSVDLLPPVDRAGLRDYVLYSLDRGIGFNYTMNASHMHGKEFTHKGLLEIISFLGELYRAGVRSLTVSLPSLIEIIRSTDYDFSIKASVICQITTPNKAMIFKKLGVDRMVVDECINRDFHTLPRMVNVFGDKLEIIVNTICHKDCPFRMFHYNQIASDSIVLSSTASANYYAHRCLMRRYEETANLLKLSWVRPEEIKHYTAIGIRHFKLQGRQAVLKGDPVRAIEAYFNESYSGDLMELLDMFSPTSNFRVAIDNRCLDGFLDPFSRQEIVCRHDCGSCHYCDRFARKCIDSGQVTEIYQNVCRFYSEYDPFNQLLASIKETGSEKEEPGDWNVEFELG